MLALLCRARNGLKMLVLHGRGQAICQITHARIQASGTRIDEEARRAVHNATSNNQVVVTQRGARGGDVYDTVGHADNGAQLDVAVQRNDVGVHAALGIPGARDARVLGGHAKRPAAGIVALGLAGAPRGLRLDKGAQTVAQIDQLQQSRTGLDSNFEDTTKEWESTEEPVLQSTRISSAVLKFGLIGLLAGIVLVCGVGTVQFLVQGKVYSGKELRDTCRLPLLGTLASGKTRQSKQLDAALDRMEHRPDGSTDAEMIRLMAATIASRAPEAKHILITGDLPADQLTALAAALQDTGALRAQVVTAAESILTCAATVPQVTSADAIVLAADCTCSHYTAVNDQNEQIQRLGKNILGCIVFE